MSEGKKLNWVQHMLLRPDTYIGSIQTEQDIFALLAEKENEGGKIVYEEIPYNPGLVKIFHEILSNAIDNFQREGSQTYIQISFNSETGEIEVCNDGAFIPVETHEYEYKDPRTLKIKKSVMYPAELYFGEDRTGTNYDDDSKRLTSGRNGYGSKATNAFSLSFEVEHTDGRKKFCQRYEKNVSVRSEPKITACKNKPYTLIRFLPDYARFHYDDLASFARIVEKYAFDTSLTLPVWFNDKKYPKKTLQQYAKLYFPGCPVLSLSVEKSEEEDEDGDGNLISEAILVDISGFPSEEPREGLTSVSFVNGMLTRTGGIHVNAWEKAFLSKVIKTYNKNKKGKKLSLKALRPHLALFVFVQIPNPTFDSQTKDRLNGPPGYPKVVSPSDEEVKKIVRWGAVKAACALMDEKKVRASKSSKVIPLSEKYDDANRAGKEPEKCTLFLTEGKSAKTFADIGREVIENGHDYLGSLALQGKVLNVSDKDITKVISNKEITIMRDLLGLNFGVDYSTTLEGLRYHKVVILTDADVDGIHIAALLINFFYTFFPGILKRESFLRIMSTAVVLDVQRHRGFYTLPEFEKWVEKNPGAKIVTKYMKGLGGHNHESTKKEFEDPKYIDLYLDGNEKEVMTVGLTGKMMEKRKNWVLKGCQKEEEEGEDGKGEGEDGEKGEGEEKGKEREKKEIFPYAGKVSISRFVDERLVEYHRETLKRSIPVLYDGFKEGQRKVLDGCFSMGLFDKKGKSKSSIKVFQLAGYVAQKEAYQHGEESLNNTIIKMAQGYVGSNNLPLLVNDGAYGSRKLNGEDAASPRYIETFLDDISRILFPEIDSSLLTRAVDDDQQPVEPVYFVPILPIVLLNGANGVASAFSTKIPCYNPLDILGEVRAWIKEEETDEYLTPWYRGFQGEIELVMGEKYPKQWISRGVIEREDKKRNTWRITELPVGLSTAKFMDHLETLRSGNKVKKSGKVAEVKKIIRGSIANYNTNNGIDVLVSFEPSFTPVVGEGPFAILQSVNSLENMVLLDGSGYPQKWACVEDIIDSFCTKRLVLYEKRREALLAKLKRELAVLSNRRRFVQQVVSKDPTVNLDLHRPKKDLDIELERREYERQISSKGKGDLRDYSYLLEMPMRSMTEEKVKKLTEDVRKKRGEIRVLKNKTARDIWLEELDLFEKEYAAFLKRRVD